MFAPLFKAPPLGFPLRVGGFSSHFAQLGTRKKDARWTLQALLFPGIGDSLPRRGVDNLGEYVPARHPKLFFQLLLCVVFSLLPCA